MSVTINNFFYQLSNIIWWCESVHILRWLNIRSQIQGRIQDFKLRGAHLKKIAPSRGRRENFWGISCEKSRFYANFRRGARRVRPTWIRPWNTISKCCSTKQDTNTNICMSYSKYNFMIARQWYLLVQYNSLNNDLHFF
jgi:hypothetical protein